MMLDIVDSKPEGVIVLHLKGKMDASTAGILDGKVRGLIAGGERRVVLDLGELSYVSSAGLRDLLIVAKQFRAVAGKLALTSLKDQVKEVFDLAGFSSFCQVY